MSCPGLLILADTYTPGWRATVDGSPTRILEAYGVMRGLRVPGGHHRVELSYRPRSVLFGGAMTLLGFLLLPLVTYYEHSLQSATAPSGIRDLGSHRVAMNVVKQDGMPHPPPIPRASE